MDGNVYSLVVGAHQRILDARKYAIKKMLEFILESVIFKNIC